MFSALQRNMARMPQRADFVMETVDVREGGRVTVRMLPDPRRYTISEKDGQALCIDLGHAFSLDDMAASFSGVPIYELSPRIGSTLDYAKSRYAALNSEMDSGAYTPPTESAASHRQLETGDEERLVGFLSVDICGATALRDPILALLDGVPVAAHPLLAAHLVVDDQFDLEPHAPVDQRVHGTAMASLVNGGQIPGHWGGVKAGHCDAGLTIRRR